MPARRANKRAAVEREIEMCALYIAMDQPASAERFVDAVEETIRLLVEHPFSGRAENFGNLRLEGLRRRPVKGFRNFLIFYLPTGVGIEVLHVYHGARDLPALFKDEE